MARFFKRHFASAENFHWWPLGFVFLLLFVLLCVEFLCFLFLFCMGFLWGGCMCLFLFGCFVGLSCLYFCFNLFVCSFCFVVCGRVLFLVYILFLFSFIASLLFQDLVVWFFPFFSFTFFFYFITTTTTITITTSTTTTITIATTTTTTTPPPPIILLVLVNIYYRRLRICNQL